MGIDSKKGKKKSIGTKKTINEVKKKNKTIFNGKRYDGLIHSAGDYLLSPIQLVNEKEIINSINTNLTAPYLITKEFISLFTSLCLYFSYKDSL